MYVPPPGSTPGPMRDMRARLRPMGIGDILDETFRFDLETMAQQARALAPTVPY